MKVFLSIIPAVVLAVALFAAPRSYAASRPSAPTYMSKPTIIRRGIPVYITLPRNCRNQFCR